MPEAKKILKEVEMESAREFEIDDCVTLKFEDGLFQVSGVIHDSERLFITNGNGEEFEVKFKDVADQWRNLKSLESHDAALLREAWGRAVAYMQRVENSGCVLKGYIEFLGPGLRAAIEGGQNA